MTPSINNGFPPVRIHTHVDTQGNLTMAEERSHVSVVTSMVSAAPCSASSGALQALWYAQPGSTWGDQWKCGNAQSDFLGNNTGGGREGWDFSTDPSNPASFPSSPLPWESVPCHGKLGVCSARGKQVQTSSALPCTGVYCQPGGISESEYTLRDFWGVTQAHYSCANRGQKDKRRNNREELFWLSY